MSSKGSEQAARKPPAAARAPAQGGAALDALSAAVESGAGLPAVARAAARVLDASVALVARAAPQAAQPGDWRARVLTVATRALRSVSPGTLAALGEGDSPEVVAVVPAREAAALARAAASLARELDAALAGFSATVAR